MNQPAPSPPPLAAVPTPAPENSPGPPPIDLEKVAKYVRRTRGRIIANAILRYFFRAWFVLLFGLRSHGRRHIPKDRGYLLLSNHQSTLDPVVNGLAIKSELRFMARNTLFKGLFAKLITYLGAFPVTRGRRDEFAFRISEGIVTSQQPLIIYGEGTRTFDGEIMEIRGGIEIISRRTKVPISPMVIDGDYEIMPRGVSLLRLRPGTIHVISAPVIEPEDYGQWPARSMPSRLRERMVEMRRDARAMRLRGGPGVTSLSGVALELLCGYLRVLLAVVQIIRGKKFEKPGRGDNPYQPKSGDNPSENAFD